jgi:hypothetical protein
MPLETAYEKSALVIGRWVHRPAHCVEATCAQPTFGGREQCVRRLLIFSALEEAKEPDPIVVELVMRAILDRGDAADGVAIPHGEKQLAIRGSIEWIRFVVEGIADGDAQWGNPLWMVGLVIDPPWQIDETAEVPRRVDREDFE